MVHHTASVSLKHDTRWGDVLEEVVGIPVEAKVSVSYYEGDAREPSESRITWTWTSQAVR